LATPLVRGTVERSVVPSRKFTKPVGTLELELMVAVSVSVFSLSV
jgi:hypothetical protein